MRRIIPRLPDASGPIEGRIAGASPPFDFIMLGESTVAGIGAPTHEFALTGQTARALARRTGRAIRWLALGRSGADARVARAELVPRLRGRRADVVAVALGVNDTIELNSVKRWRHDVRDLISAIRDQLGGVKIVLAGAPPLGSFPAFPDLLKTFLGTRARLLDQALSELAFSLPNLVHEPMMEGLSEHHFCEDRFHPSVAGYALWGEHLSRFL
jgi:lysophospholipase L1-like esterase